MRKQRIFSFLLALVIVFGNITLGKPLVSEAASRAKLKSVKVELKKKAGMEKKGSVWYIAKGNKTKVLVTSKLTKKVKAKVSKSFHTSNSKVLSASRTGVLFAKKEGKAKVKVTVKTKKAKKVSRSRKIKTITVVVLTQNDFKKKFSSSTKTETNTDKNETKFQNIVNDNTHQRSNYKYKIKILNTLYDRPIYACTHSDGRFFDPMNTSGKSVIFYIQTDNPISAAYMPKKYYDYYLIHASGDMCTNAEQLSWYADVVASEEEKEKYCSYKFSFIKPRKETFYLVERYVERSGDDFKFYKENKIAKIEIDVRDETELYRDWCKKVLKECTNDNMTKWEKVEAVSTYLRENLTYEHYWPADGYDAPILDNKSSVKKDVTLISDETIPCYLPNGFGVHCKASPVILRDITSLFGVNDVHSEGHEAKVTINGETEYYYPTPPIRTSIINKNTYNLYVDADKAPEASVNPSIELTYY